MQLGIPIFILNMSTTKAFGLDISEKILEEARPFFRDIEPENLLGKKKKTRQGISKIIFFMSYIIESDIVKKASDLMTAITNINRGIDVIHPGNTVQYFQLSVEYGVKKTKSIKKRYSFKRIER